MTARVHLTGQPVALAAWLALAMIVAACRGDDDPPPPSAVAGQPGETVVTISDFQFEPATLTVSGGARVTWRNAGPTDHTVADLDRAAWSSPILAAGESFSIEAPAAGRYAYWCTLHPSMRGLLEVR